MDETLRRIKALLTETGISANQVHAEIGITDYKFRQILEDRLPPNENHVRLRLLEYLEHPETQPRKPGRPTKAAKTPDTTRTQLTPEQLSRRLMETMEALHRLETLLGDENYSPVLAFKALIEGLVQNAERRRQKP